MKRVEDGDLNWYDYGFRYYDAQIGRFPQLDPLTFAYPYYSPYQYAGLEPVGNVDVDGLEPAGVLNAPGKMLGEVTVTSVVKTATSGVTNAAINTALNVSLKMMAAYTNGKGQTFWTSYSIGSSPSFTYYVGERWTLSHTELHSYYTDEFPQYTGRRFSFSPGKARKAGFLKVYIIFGLRRREEICLLECQCLWKVSMR